ncbi:MAG: CHAP domain-containing protein [Ruminococcus sp.]
MADIKTRDMVKGTIKTIDKAAVASERMKQAYISTKERAENSTYAAENSADEYASDKFERGIDATVHEGIHQFDKAGRKGVETTKDNIHKAKDGIDRFKEKRAKKAFEMQSEKFGGKAAKTAERTASQTGSKTVKTAEKSTTKTIKQSASSAGKKTIKTVGKSGKTAAKSVKTAERTAKTAIKTTKQAAKAAQKTAQASAKAVQKAAQAAKATAKAAVAAIKVAVKATIAAVKAIIAGVKALVAAIAAGGWVAVVVILVICLVALILGSVFGIFFSGEDSGTGQTMQTAVQEINTEYDNKLLEIRNGTTYDVLEMSGSRAVWKDVLAVYAVKTNTDPDNPQEVATMDDNKKQLLKDLFWEMNEVSSRTESVSETVITETDDGNGNIVQTETTVTRTYLYITVAHKTVDEMASQYGFNQEQKDYLTELLKPENNSLWAAALYGINYSDDQIVTVALTQIGNVGGDPYWSWYGFGSRVEWCACFVSWCANECGYIDTGVIPKYAGCVNGVQWFKDRGQWVDGSAEPAPGMIIFFDWDSPDGSSGPQDGLSDHTGIVQKVENGIVYTVEGNSGDSVRQKQYSVGYYEILGYGVPQY